RCSKKTTINPARPICISVELFPRCLPVITFSNNSGSKAAAPILVFDDEVDHSRHQEECGHGNRVEDEHEHRPEACLESAGHPPQPHQPMSPYTTKPPAARTIRAGSVMRWCWMSAIAIAANRTNNARCQTRS